MKSEPAFLSRVLTVSAVAVLVLLAWKLASLLLLLFGGILLAVALRSGANFLCRNTGLPPRVGVIAVVAVVVAILGGLGWFVGDRVVSQFSELTRSLPMALDAVREWLSHRAWGQFMLERSRSLGEGGIMPQITGVAVSVAGTLSDVLLILVVMVFLAMEPSVYINGAVTLFSPRLRPRVREVAASVGRALRSWLLAQGIAMVAIGVITTLGLMLLGIPLALALGVLAGLLEFIPFIGPVLSAVPAILFGFTVSPIMALWVSLFYLAVQQMEGNVLQPIIQEKVVSLPPVLTLAAAVGMAMLFGFAGLIFATPLVVVLMVVVRMVYVEDVLGDEGG